MVTDESLDCNKDEKYSPNDLKAKKKKKSLKYTSKS